MRQRHNLLNGICNEKVFLHKVDISFLQSIYQAQQIYHKLDNQYLFISVIYKYSVLILKTGFSSNEPFFWKYNRYIQNINGLDFTVCESIKKMSVWWVIQWFLNRIPLIYHHNCVTNYKNKRIPPQWTLILVFTYKTKYHRHWYCIKV